MKYVSRILRGFCILISVLSLLSLLGCAHWDKGKNKDYQRHYDNPGDIKP